MKYFLLIAGDNYYPSHRTGDWIGCFETYQEALNQIKDRCVVRDREFDWYDIVDLREWIND